MVSISGEPADARDLFTPPPLPVGSESPNGSGGGDTDTLGSIGRFLASGERSHQTTSDLNHSTPAMLGNNGGNNKHSDLETPPVPT